MQITLRPLNSVLPYARNPRHNQSAVAIVAASIREFGFKQPIVVDKDSIIVVGHTRWLAAQALGLKQVPVLVADDLTPAKIKAYRLADNRTAETATWDEALLGLELSELQASDLDMALTGFDAQEIAHLSAVTQALRHHTEETVPDRPPVAQSQSGERWALGRHRLFCGDATSAEAIQRLMQGTQGDLGFSDPPYNVAYTGYTADQLTLMNDQQDPQQFAAFLGQLFTQYRAALKKTASLYVCHSSSFARTFEEALEASGFRVRNALIWAKHHFAWGRGRYKYQHEPIFYCYQQGEVDVWYGDKTQSTLWQVDKPAANRLHPTMKPVALIEKALENSSRPGDTVVDLVAGSGSTLLACEQSGRTAYLMEMYPRYCDVIKQRWENWSGEVPQLLVEEKS